MGKEIVVIDPDELQRQLVQKPARPGDQIIDITEIPGTDPDEIITTTRQPFGEK